MDQNQNNNDLLGSSRKKGLFIQLAITVILSVLLISFELNRQRTYENKYVSMVQAEIAAVNENFTRLPEVNPELVKKKDPNEKEGLNQVDETEEEPADKVFYIVQEMPSFQGKGQDGFRNWISEKIEYPKELADSSILGKVFVSFVVEADGTVSTVKLVRGLNPVLDKQAIKLIQSSPKWVPGKRKGKAVRVGFTFPVNFDATQ